MTDKKREIEPQAPQTPERIEGPSDRRIFSPRVDIYERKNATVLLADMPGVDDKSVEIALEKNVLTLSGHVAPVSYEGYDPVYTEYETGDFERAFTLSSEVDQSRIQATVKDGVLRLTLPKVKPQPAKKIEVKGG
ncbi:MAG: Hsp20/alpha crystallin family protein [Planctomycetota bacterium]